MRRTAYRRVGWVVAGIMTCSMAMAQDNPFRKLTLDAIDSPGGTATFTFDKTIPWVKAMRQQLATEGSVTVVTKVVKRFREEGCARLQTVFTVHEAALQGGRLVDQQFSINYNLCRDGLPPKETLDIRDIRDWTSGSTEQSTKPRGVRIVPLDKPNTPWSTRDDESSGRDDKRAEKPGSAPR